MRLEKRLRIVGAVQARVDEGTLPYSMRFTSRRDLDGKRSVHPLFLLHVALNDATDVVDGGRVLVRVQCGGEDGRWFRIEEDAQDDGRGRDFREAQDVRNTGSEGVGRRDKVGFHIGKRLI